MRVRVSWCEIVRWRSTGRVQTPPWVAHGRLGPRESWGCILDLLLDSLSLRSGSFGDARSRSSRLRRSVSRSKVNAGTVPAARARTAALARRIAVRVLGVATVRATALKTAVPVRRTVARVLGVATVRATALKI